jgi:membrane fusion protein (multidrug efflux system)
MATPFTRTTHSLHWNSGRRTRAGAFIVLLLLGGWAGWFFFAKVPVYETTPDARLEVTSAVHPVHARVAGQVVGSHLVVGKKVAAGEILLTLDAERQKRQLSVLRKRRETYWPQIQALRAEMSTTDRLATDEQATGRIAREETRRQLGEAAAMLEYWHGKQARLEQLRQGAHVSEDELLNVSAQAKSQQARAETLRVSIERTRSEYRTKRTERRTRLDRLNQEIQALQALAATTGAEMARLEYEIEIRRIRAPVAGEIGEAAVLHAGAMVREGEGVAAIIPEGSLHVVAAFHPAQALGRIRSGQKARLRLAGFPWVRYGALAATVTRVAREAREGRIRVELSPDPASPLRVKVEHGMPGELEVEVERVSPAILALRAAGSWLSPVPGEPMGRVVFETRGEAVVRVEVPDTDEKRALGLMYRRSLAPNDGMLFIFPTEEVHAFWMRNTYVPLDLVFLDARQVVVGVVENAAPLTETPRTIPIPSRYVVEVNANFARSKGIGPGTRARFEGIRSPLLVGP